MSMRPLLLRWVEEEDEWHLMRMTTLEVVAKARKRWVQLLNDWEVCMVVVQVQVVLLVLVYLVVQVQVVVLVLVF
jgi:hypothetical protein